MYMCRSKQIVVSKPRILRYLFQIPGCAFITQSDAILRHIGLLVASEEAKQMFILYSPIYTEEILETSLNFNKNRHGPHVAG